jgi:hypothetical protein
MLSDISPIPDAGPAAPDWNVIVTLSEPTFRIARNLLARWGRLRRTEYHNVAVMAVTDTATFLQEFAAALEESPGILNAMSHVVPFEHLFTFKDAAEFEAKSREIALSYVPRLAGKSFHVRLRRRGLKSPPRRRSVFSMTSCLGPWRMPAAPARSGLTIPTMCCCSRPSVEAAA